MASWSALRFVPAISHVSRSIPDTATISTITVAGPADPHSPHDGLFFYGVHLVEAALALCAALDVKPDDAAEPTVSTRDDGVTATWRWGAALIRLCFVDPSRPSPVGFTASVAAGARHLDVELALDQDYLAPVVDLFLAMCRVATPPPGDDLVRPVRMLAAVDRQLRA